MTLIQNHIIRVTENPDTIPKWTAKRRTEIIRQKQRTKGFSSGINLQGEKETERRWNYFLTEVGDKDRNKHVTESIIIRSGIRMHFASLSAFIPHPFSFSHVTESNSSVCFFFSSPEWIILHKTEIFFKSLKIIFKLL